jgi:DNA modification methylase
MKPYYNHGGITIYHGDCREVLATLQDDSMDLCVADPPYPGLKGLHVKFQRLKINVQ